MLRRIEQLRAVTSEQAHLLVEVFSGTHPSNTRQRLHWLKKNGLLRLHAAELARGWASRTYYTLSWHAQQLLRSRATLQLPAPHILKYLLFRNDVYAALRAQGWLVATPVLTGPVEEKACLHAFEKWALASHGHRIQKLVEARASQLDVERARMERDRLSRFLPQALTFEFALRLDGARRASGMRLLVIDDPRRSIERQLEDLPSTLPPRSGITLRDHLSRIDAATGRLTEVSPRLARWRRALSDRFGDEAVASDVEFPTLWTARNGRVASRVLDLGRNGVKAP